MNCINNIKKINCDNKKDLELVKDYDNELYLQLKNRSKKENNIITMKIEGDLP